jgi:hypothetical protein
MDNPDKRISNVLVSASITVDYAAGWSLRVFEISLQTSFLVVGLRTYQNTTTQSKKREKANLQTSQVYVNKDQHHIDPAFPGIQTSLSFFLPSPVSHLPSPISLLQMPRLKSTHHAHAPTTTQQNGPSFRAVEVREEERPLYKVYRPGEFAGGGGCWWLWLVVRGGVVVVVVRGWWWWELVVGPVLCQEMVVPGYVLSPAADQRSLISDLGIGKRYGDLERQSGHEDGKKKETRRYETRRDETRRKMEKIQRMVRNPEQKRGLVV